MKSLKKCAVALAMAVCAFGASADPVEISTAEQFVSALSANPSGDYKLTADIALNNWESLEDFSGTLDGNSKSILGLEGALFQNLSGTVKNLTIDGAVGGVNTQLQLVDRTNFAFLALTATGATIDSVSVKGYSLVNSQSPDKNVPRNEIGFIVADVYDGTSFRNTVVLSGCTVSLGGDINFGGIAGAIKRTSDFSSSVVASFSNCINFAEIVIARSCSAGGNGAIGGIVGREETGSTSSIVEFVGCVNNGSATPVAASGNTIFGGILGISSSSASGTSVNLIKFVSCANHGGYYGTTKILSNNMRLGGLLGQGSQYSHSVYIEKCFNDGDFLVPNTSTSGGSLGGFIGSLTSIAKNSTFTIRNSVQRGILSMPGSSTKIDSVGGVFGSVSSGGKSGYTGIEVKIENCSFSGAITSQKKGLVAAQFCTATTIQSDLKFTIDNCWFAESGDMIDTASSISAYSATNNQIHQTGATASECAALSTVAQGVASYDDWEVRAESEVPEPMFGGLHFLAGFYDYDGKVIALRQVANGEAAVAPANPKRVGYAFKNWEPSDFSCVTSNMSMVATYEQSADFRTVTFVDYDERELEQVTVPSGTAVGDQAPTPTRTGYTLVGWTLDGEDYDLATPVTEDITLDAKYQINVYNVVFFDWEDNQLGETQKIEYLSAAVAPALPAIPEGKVFWKWSDDFSSVTEDMEIYARICDREQHISTAEDFAEKINAESPSVATFCLDADIVLNDWTDVDFRSTLRGRGHVIAGLKAPLFNTLDHATVEDLVLSNCTVKTKDQDEVIGCLARTAGNATTIRNVVTTYDCAVEGASANVVAGGIVGLLTNSQTYEGENGSWIIACTNCATVAKSTTDSNSKGSLGGIVGRVEAQGATGQPFVTNGIYRCVNFGPLACNFNGGRIAGLVGKVNTMNARALVSILKSSNFADVIGVTVYGSDQNKKLYAAGFVAHLNSSSCDLLIDGCVNRGRISVGFEPDGQIENLDKKAAGMIANIETLAKNCSLTILNSANYGDVEGENAGGVIAEFGTGGSYSGTLGVIENCASYGSVTGRTAVALGIAKWNRPNEGVGFTRVMTNCFFVADAERSLPLVGGDTAGFVTDGCFLDSDPGYNASSVRAQLNAVARDKEWGLWRTASFNGIAYPQLKAFSRANGLMLFVK